MGISDDLLKQSSPEHPMSSIDPVVPVENSPQYFLVEYQKLCERLGYQLVPAMKPLNDIQGFITVLTPVKVQTQR